MLIMKKILSVVGITGGTFFLLVAAICVEEWFSDPAYAADMEISGLIMCIVLGIFGVILIVLGIQTLRLQKLYREYKEIAEASNMDLSRIWQRFLTSRRIKYVEILKNCVKRNILTMLMWITRQSYLFERIR